MKIAKICKKVHFKVHSFNIFVITNSIKLYTYNISLKSIMFFISFLSIIFFLCGLIPLSLQLIPLEYFSNLELLQEIFTQSIGRRGKKKKKTQCFYKHSPWQTPDNLSPPTDKSVTKAICCSHNVLVSNLPKVLQVNFSIKDNSKHSLRQLLVK